MTRFRYHCKTYCKELILGPLFKLFEAILELFIPLLVAGIIDIGIANEDVPFVLRYGIFMIVFAFAGFIMGMICQYYAAKASQAFGADVRNLLLQHVLNLSEKDSAPIGTNSLITRLTNDINQVVAGINITIRLGTRIPFLAIGSIFMAFYIDRQIGFIFLIATPLIGLTLFFIMKKSLPYFQDIQKKQDTLSHLTKENLEGVRVIRSFSKQDAEIKHFTQAGFNLTQVIIFVGKISALLNPLTFVFANIAIVFILWIGGNHVFQGRLETGQIVALINYMNTSLLSLVILSQIMIIFTKAIASWKRIAEVLAIKPTILDGIPSRQKQSNNNPIISFEQVSFSYHKESESALKNLSFSLRPGQTIGIIGGTGSGKSTLGKLLLRFYDTTEGAIKINNIPIKNYALSTLTEKIGYIPQNATLFQKSVRENLLIGKEDASDDEIWRALDIAQGKSFVSEMKQGLDTHIHEGGKNLSGGQKQRLAIARAILKKPDILILDDANSALDYTTDAALRTALQENTKEITTIFISQRAKSIQHADSILVLDNGCLVGQGQHGELFKNCRIYRELCSSQHEAVLRTYEE
ncbi:MAG: ABC transporter ATP-binding protein/permease [Lachnospiraceae bacterium]|nr:ABC transporter ATP-binding protein/permease [Lachnospiraceae bacterium]